MKKKKRLLKFIFAVLFLLPVCANATNITFTSNGTISGTDAYEEVYVQNNGTVVNMSGGRINHSLVTSDGSTFNMSGGLISGNIYIDPLSTFNISNGLINSDYGYFVLQSGATLNISGGNITAHNLKTSPDSSIPALPVSIVNINGGTLNFGMFDICGTLNVYRGLLNVDDVYIHYLLYLPNVNIYGSEFNYNPSTQILTGRLLDNNLFTIRGLDESEYTRFNLIPEPISLLLFGVGCLVLRKSKK